MEKVSKQSTFLLQTKSQCLFFKLRFFLKLSLEVHFDCTGWLKASLGKVHFLPGDRTWMAILIKLIELQVA